MNALLLVALCVASAVAAPNGYGYSAPTVVRSEHGYSAPAVIRSDYGYSATGSSSLKAQIPIVKQVLRNDNAGNYNLEVETGDGSKTSEVGSLKNLGHPEGPSAVKVGSYSWTAPDGQVFTVSYTADENGFVARGNHLPTPPPIPEEIQKSLALPRNPEYNTPALKVDSGYYSAPAPALKVDSGYYSAPAPALKVIAPAPVKAESGYYSAPAAPSIRFDYSSAPVRASNNYGY